MDFIELVKHGQIIMDLQARSRFEAIEEMLAASTKQLNRRMLGPVRDCVISRETRGSTVISNGVAAPHGRLEELPEVFLVTAVSRNGINGKAGDGKPIHLLFLFVTPVAQTALHLKLLSQISMFAEDDALVSRIVAARDADEFRRLLSFQHMQQERYVYLPREEFFLELDTGESGLTDEEAVRRTKEYGKNELVRKKGPSLFFRLLFNFGNFLAMLLWVSAILAFAIGMKEVGLAVIVVILINGIFGFWQEFKAERAVEALSHLIPVFARIIRNGTERKVLSTDVVPGDIMLFEEGDAIVADARLIDSEQLRVDSSVFSGESRPGYKTNERFQKTKEFAWTEMPNLVFAGTSVAGGSGKAVVIATGMSTEIGRIASLAQSVKPELSPLQKEINQLTKYIAVFAVTLGVLFFIVGALVAHLPVVAAALFAIGIIIGNVPEGLLPTVTLALAVAVQRMARRNVLVKKLSSVETLGSTQIICTDKTGTLTTNQVCVVRIWIDGSVIEVTGSGFEPKGSFIRDGRPYDPRSIESDGLSLLLQTGMLCSTARLLPPSADYLLWRSSGDPTESALLTLAVKAGYEINYEREASPLLSRFPFESVRKRMSSIHRLADGTVRSFVKGSPGDTLDLCASILRNGRVEAMTKNDKQQIAETIDAFAAEGLRVLAFAYKDLNGVDVSRIAMGEAEQALTFIGLTGMHDPPRPEIAPAIEQCHRAGIRVVMITGDYEITAEAISRQTGIVRSNTPRVVTGQMLNGMSETHLREMLSEETVFARVNPEHKYRIVDAFKSLGRIVAVTGDGVNDAPALKRADIGIAMGLRGTDVAKDAAEMVLADDNFASIVAGIEEGRAVLDNIRNFLAYIFAHLVPEVIPYGIYAIFKTPVPITALQILAIDLGTETLPALALGTERPQPGVMQKPPRSKKQGLVSPGVLLRGYAYLGLLNTIAVLGGYFWVLLDGGWRLGQQLEPSPTVFTNPLHMKAMSMVFAGIVVMQIPNVFACRSSTRSAFELGLFSNRFILWGIFFELAFAVMLIYVPFFQKIFNTAALGASEWIFLFICAVTMFFIEEFRKKVAPGLFKST